MGGIKDLGFGIDMTFSLSDALKTTTADFTPVCLNPSNASDWTVHGIEEEGTDNVFVIGMLQDGQSSNSVVGRVRMLGPSKAYAGAAISAGDFLVVANSSLGTADVGGTVLTLTRADDVAQTAAATSIGRALEAAAATGDALTIFVCPTPTYVTA